MSDATKKCSTCQVFKPREEFHKSVSTKTGLANQCKPCCAEYHRKHRLENLEEHRRRNKEDYQQNKSRYLETQKRWNKRNKESQDAWHRNWRLERMGLSTAEFEEKLQAQGGVCAICELPNKNMRPLHVDHDHECHPAGKHACKDCVRGLLCNECNTSLHKLETTAGWADKAVAYLNRFKKEVQ